jgi:predicted Zn-dependent protease
MSDYLVKVWAGKSRVHGLETRSINGLKAATATIQQRSNQVTINIRLLVIRKDRQRVYQFAFLTKDRQSRRWSTAFRRTGHSFRTLTKSEASEFKPLRVRTRRVRRGDTVSSLARRMAGRDGYLLDRFLVINGLTKDALLRSGQKVKIIAD